VLVIERKDSMLAHSRGNRVKTGAETSEAVSWSPVALSFMAIGGVFAYVLLSSDEPKHQGAWNDKYGRKRVR